MEPLISDAKLSTQPINFNNIYLCALPALDGGFGTPIPDPETPTVSRLRKLGKGLIKHPEQTFPRRHSLSYTFQDIPTVTDGRVNPSSSRRNSILRVGDCEDFSPPVSTLPIPFESGKSSTQLRRPMRKPKVNKFVDETAISSGLLVPSAAVKECEGSAILLKTERRHSQSQVPHSSRGWRRTSISLSNSNALKGTLASVSPAPSFRDRHLSAVTNTPVATSSSSPITTALGASQRKNFTFPKNYSSASSEMSHRFDDAKSNQPSTPTQRLIRVQSKINMTSEIMDEVKRHSRVASYVRTDQERYREILEQEQSKLILLLGRKFNLERSIEVILDTYEKEMSHKRNTFPKITNEKSDASVPISRRYSTAKGTINRHRPSIYLYRAEEIRKLNQLNNAFLSNLVRDGFNVKSIYNFIEALETQLRDVCERTGLNVPDHVSLIEERSNPIRNARSNLNDIHWQIESMDLGLNTDVDLPNDLSSMSIPDQILSIDVSHSAEHGSPRTEHLAEQRQGSSGTRPILNLPKCIKVSDDLVHGSPAAPDHPSAMGGNRDRIAKSTQFVQTPEPSVVGFSLLEDSILHGMAGVGSLKLLGFMFDAIAAAQVADSFKHRGSLFPLAEDAKQPPGSDDLIENPQTLTSCQPNITSPHEAPDMLNFEALRFKGSELVTPHGINVDAHTGAMITTSRMNSTDIEEWKQSVNLEDTLAPLYFNKSSNSDEKDRGKTPLSSDGTPTTYSGSVAIQAATHAATLRPDLLLDLKRLYKEYDYHQLIEERRQIRKALAANRLGDGEAYIAELNERIRRAKMHALENQKETDDSSESISKMFTHHTGTRAATPAHYSAGSSREQNHPTESRCTSQMGTPAVAVRNSDSYLENENIAKESSPLDVEEIENKTKSLSTGAEAALDDHTEAKSLSTSKKLSLQSSPDVTSLENEEQILLSTRTPFGLHFTVSRKLSNDVVPVGKKVKNKKKANARSRTKKNSNLKSAENSTSFLYIRVRNENLSSPCEASMKLIAEKLVNLKLLSSDDIILPPSNEPVKVVLEPGEAKTLACLDPVDKSRRVHFNNALIFGGTELPNFDKFNSLNPLSSRQNSSLFSIHSADLEDLSTSLKTKLERDNRTRPRATHAKKISTPSKFLRTSSKSATSPSQEVSKAVSKFVTKTKEGTEPLPTVVASKEGTTISPSANSEKASSKKKRPSDKKIEIKIPVDVSAEKGIANDLLQPREVVDWGTSHENPEKEATEKNMILLSILQTQAASEANHGFSTESDSHAPNSVTNVLQRMSFTEKEPLKGLQAAETIVSDIVQQIAEDVRAEEAEGFSGLDITHNEVYDSLSHDKGTPHHKSHTSDGYTSQEAQASHDKREDPQVKDSYIDYPELSAPLATTSRSSSSVLPLLSATCAKGAHVEPHGPSDAVRTNDSSSEQVSDASERVSLPLLDGETFRTLNDTVAFSPDTKIEASRDTQGKGGPRPLGRSVHSSKPGFVRKLAQKVTLNMLPHSQEEMPNRDRSIIGHQLYTLNKDLSDGEMQQQLTTALKEIGQNAPEAFVSRSEATGNLTVLMPSNLVSESTKRSKLLVLDNGSNRPNSINSSIKNSEASNRIHAGAHSSKKSSERPVESNISADAADCPTFVASVLNMAKFPSFKDHKVSAETIKGTMNIAANDVLTFNNDNTLMQSMDTIEKLEQETRLLYMQDPVRYNAVVDEFMGLVTSELNQSSEQPHTEANKDVRVDGFLTDTMKDLIRQFMRQKLPENDVAPAVPAVPALSGELAASAVPKAPVISAVPEASVITAVPEASVISALPEAPALNEPPTVPPDALFRPHSLPSFQSTLPPTSSRNSLVYRSTAEGRRSCVQVVNLVPILPLSSGLERGPLSSTHIRMYDGSIKYDDSFTGEPNDSLMKPQPVSVLPKHEPKTEFLEQKLESEAKAHTMDESANEIKRLLYEQFKAKLILSIFVSYTRRMWALKQKESRNQVVDMITKTMARTAEVAWEFEKHRVLQLKKLIHILDRQTGRQKGWIPYYTDQNVLVMQGVNTPCARFTHYEAQRRLRRAMWLARCGKILPLRLVQQDIVRSWNKHLLLGYSKYIIDEKHSEETRNRSGGGRYIPIRFFHMHTPGERARYMRRARFGAAFQFVSKRYSPRIYREKEFPLPLH